MSIGIRRAIVVGAATVAMVGGGAMNTADAASTGAASAKAPTTSQTKPCQKDKNCARGYSDGYTAGVRSCKAGGRGGGGGGGGFGEYQRGFDLGFKHARAKYCH